MWLEGKKYYFFAQRRRRLEKDNFFIFLFSLIIMTWKGSLEEKKKKLFWGTFYCFLIKKIGNCFLESVFFPGVNLTNFVSSFILFFWPKKNHQIFYITKLKIKNLAYISRT
jgi:hypothetical protein